jgi:co-chaperonin GroES (HSP10)
MKTKIFIISSFLLVLIFGLKYRPKNEDFFTFIVLPDTQKYTSDHPEIINNQVEWVIKNKDKLNIEFVSQLGDIVQNGKWESSEWDTASKAYSLLEKENIPYTIIPGNHDVDEGDVSSSKFNKYNEIFPLSRFNTKPWFGGNYMEYQNNYQLLSVDGIDFIILNVEVDPPDDVLNWANGILEKYKNRKAIFTTHNYLQDKNGERNPETHFRENGNSGEEIWNKVIKENCNVFLVLSGHFHNEDGENRLISSNKCGNEVNQIIQDYQGRENGGNGLLRIYNFYPAKQELSVSTYSTVLDKYEEDQDSAFTIKLSF